MQSTKHPETAALHQEDFDPGPSVAHQHYGCGRSRNDGALDGVGHRFGLDHAGILLNSVCLWFLGIRSLSLLRSVLASIGSPLDSTGSIGKRAG